MFNRFLSVKIAQQGPGKYDPDGRFVPADVLSPWTFCPHGRFVRRTFCLTGVLSPRMFCPTDVLSLLTFCPHGRFVPTDVLSTDVLSPDVLSPDVLSGHPIYQYTWQSVLDSRVRTLWKVKLKQVPFLIIYYFNEYQIKLSLI